MKVNLAQHNIKPFHCLQITVRNKALNDQCFIFELIWTNDPFGLASFSLTNQHQKIQASELSKKVPKQKIWKFMEESL